MRALVSSLLLVPLVGSQAKDPALVRISEVQALAQGESQAAGSRSLVVYDVADVLARNAGEPEAADAVGYAASIAQRGATLADLARAFLEPAFDRERDRVEATATGTVIAQLTPAGHAWLAKFLELQRANDCLIDSQFQLLTGPNGAFDALVPKDAGFARISAADAAEFVAKAQAGESCEVVLAPRLVTFNRQKGTLSVLDQVSYVKDWTIELVEPGHRAIAEPNVDVVQSGLVLELRGVVLDPTGIGAQIELTQASVEQPIPTRKIRLPIAGSTEVEIGLPQVQRVGLRANVALEPGSVAILRAPFQEDGREAVVLLQLTRVDAQKR